MSKNVANEEIRERAKKAGIKLWEIADQMGISCAWFSVRLRKELPQAEKAEILTIIDRLAKEEM